LTDEWPICAAPSGWEIRTEHIMVAEPLTIEVEPGSELARALAEANGRPVRLVSNGVRFRVNRDEEDIWAGYDPEKIREGLERYAGIISPEEAERIKEMIYRAREEGTRPTDRS
jgi:hypothetical protein